MSKILKGLLIISMALMTAFALPAYADETILRSRDLRFAVTLPDGWEDMADSLSVSSSDRGLMLRCGDRKNAAFLVFACESAGEETADFEEYRGILVSGITENVMFENVTVEDPEEMTLKGTGLRGDVTEFHAAYSGMPVSGRIYVFEGVGEYMQFFCWTLEERALSMRPVFDHIVNSLRIER